MEIPGLSMDTISQSPVAKILEAVERAKAFKLCLRRIWAVAGSLPNREHNLPALIPAPGMFPVPNHEKQHHKHEQCTFDFCEHSRVDFTSVPQHHECGANCGTLRFPLEMLDERVANGGCTAWKLEDRSLLDTPHPYMAVSHVWADGTGTGAWGAGQVNKCLYDFFSDIARSFQCEGVWWDTISIPQGEEARGKALNNMQNNYANARITLVHDSYLREWEWVNAEIACFSIVMSPWFSRGWTSLELAKSHKVKILFKSRNGGHVIKDLDVDILAEPSSSTGHQATADSIRRLRSSRMDSFGDLLAILGPRDTSKPRDIPIISGLLAGVDVSGELSQQEIYQRILRKLGKILPGHLFHNSATMSSQSFNWCPTNILDMPPAENDAEYLQLRENGDLIGQWRVYTINSIAIEDYIWNDTHPLTRVALESALKGHEKMKHLLLVEAQGFNSRALIVKLMRNENETIPLARCQFVGPVYFRSVLETVDKSKYQDAKVMIGSAEDLRELSEDAWDYICRKKAPNDSDNKGSSWEEAATNVPGICRHKSRASPPDQDDPVSLISKDWSTLFYAEKGASKWLFTESIRHSKSSGHMMLYLVEDGQNSDTKTCRAFLYGNEAIFKYVNRWLNQNANETGQIVLLVVDEDDEIRESTDTKAKRSLEAAALLEAATGGYESLVALLLDDQTPHTQNSSQETPLHLAAKSGHEKVVKKLLTSNESPETASYKDSNGRMAIHVAAESGFDKIVNHLLEKTKDLNAQEDTMRFTALHLAAKKGHSEIVRLLLSKQVDSNIEDSEEKTALHYAAEEGHRDIVKKLVENGATISHKDQKKQTALHLAACKGHLETVCELLAQQAELDTKNKEGQTALHLAAEKGHVSVVKELLKKGAKASVSDSRENTALHLASEKMHSDIVLILLEAFNKRFDQGELDKALLLAAENKSENTVVSLLEFGARSGLQNSEKMTALHKTIQWSNERITKQIIDSQSHLDTKDKQKALLMAAGKGMKDAVEALLKKGAALNSRDSKGRTALHLAAINSHREVITVLLDPQRQDRPAVNLTDSLNRTALHWAAFNGLKVATELILDEKADPVLQDERDQTALILAAGAGRLGVVQTLLGRGSDPKTTDKNGNTALHRATARGYDKVVRELLKCMRTGACDKYKQEALKLAAEKGHSSMVMMLLDSFADPANCKLVIPEALFLATASGHATAVDKLLDRNADPNHRDSQGRTALILASERGYTSIVLKLLEAGASPNIQENSGGSTALHFAVRNDHRSIIEVLHLAGADLDVQDHAGRTALLVAMEVIGSRIPSEDPYKVHLNPFRRKYPIFFDAERRVQGVGLESFSILRYLLSNRASPHIQDMLGQTALHWAVRLNLHLTSKDLIYSCRNASLDVQDKKGRTPLLLAAEGGHVGLVELLLYCGFQPDVPDENKQTALLMAAKNGDNMSVTLLLHSKADPNLSDHRGRTALLLAAENGDNASVIRLLRRQADPNLSDHRGRTALLQAAQNGHESVVASLLANNANPDARDDMGRTVLLLAAENGNSSIVEKLLNYKANPTIADHNGKKAWQKAVDQGHAAVVNLLLSSNPETQIQDMKSTNEALLLASWKGWVDLACVLLKKKADVTFQSREGWTALHMASMNGHQEVVKLLADNGIGMIIKDNKGRTALFQAVESGFVSIVRLLVRTEEVSADIKGWMGQEALLFAAEKGYSEIVKILLESNVDCDSIDPVGRTAMSLAAANGNTPVVELLLRKGAKSAIEDDHKRTALHHAAWGGFANLVKLLLDNRASLTALDKRRQSALHLAAERGARDVVDQLLEKRANANVKSDDGQTALHRAAWGGSLEVVTLLRKNGADPSIRDKSGNKPWKVAAEKGHESIVKVLLGEEHSLKDECILEEKALIFAARMGYSIIAASLLERGIETAVRDKEGRTPLHLATERGDKKLVALLTKNGEKSLDMLDKGRWTALCLGVQNGHAAVVEELLEKGADANIQGENGRTALHLAAQNGNLEVVQILVKHKADPHVRDIERRKAWLLAAEAGYNQIVRLLLEKEVDLHSQGQNREELFLQMAKRGSLPMVQLLLEKGVYKDGQDESGKTAVRLAAENAQEEVVRLLLWKGADLAIPDSRGQTPLLWAAKTGNDKYVSLFLEKISSEPQKETQNGPSDDADSVSSGEAGEESLKTSSSIDWKESPIEAAMVDGSATVQAEKQITNREAINHTDYKGRTALLIAIEKNHDSAAKLLLNRGSPDINIQGLMRKTALHLAAEKNNSTLVKMMLERGAEQNLQDSLGRTALFLAAEKNSNDAVKTLLELGSGSQDMQDSLKRTSLHLAAEKANKPIVEMLLKNGAEVNIQDWMGRTALLLAAENGDGQIVDLLLNKGAQQQLQDSTGRTPLLLAVAHGDKVVVKRLLADPNADLSVTDSKGRNLLTLAVLSGSKDVVWLLAEKKVGTNR